MVGVGGGWKQWRGGEVKKWEPRREGDVKCTVSGNRGGRRQVIRKVTGGRRNKKKLEYTMLCYIMQVQKCKTGTMRPILKWEGG